MSVFSGAPEAAGGVQLIVGVPGVCRGSLLAEGFDETPTGLVYDAMPGELGCYD